MIEVDNEYLPLPFPEEEIRILKQIVLKKYNEYIPDLEIFNDDLIQEVSVMIYQKKEKYLKVRETMNSEMILRKYISNEVNAYIQNTIREKYPYSHEELAELIRNQVQKKSGRIYELYFMFPKHYKTYIENIYVNKTSKYRSQEAEKLGISYSKKTSLEFKLKQLARIELHKQHKGEYENEKQRILLT